MRILLLNPPWPGTGIGTRSQNRIIKKRADKYLQYPILMGYSAARLKGGGHEVVYLDSILDNLDYEQTTGKIKEFNPDVIFVETVTPSINHDYQYFRELKEKTGAKIVVSGPHVTYLGGKAIEECAAIDAIIKADYDTRILEVVENLDNPAKLREIKAIAFRHKDKIVDTGPKYFFPDLDKLPFPDRETIPLNRYGEAFYNKLPFTNMLTTRGCPNNCNYCITANIMEGVKWRERSIENVIEEIKELVGKYGVKEINLDDATFNVRRERVLEFCEALKKNKLKILWICNARVDNIDPEMLKAMRSAGCKMIRYGVESADEEILRYMNKNITLDQVRRAFYLTKKAGILALGGFMFGFPLETKETVEKTIQFMKEIRPDMIQASIPMPYPGTRMFEQAQRANQLIFEHWEEFDMTKGPVVKMKGLQREDLKSILARVYREFYLRPGFVWQTIWHIRRPSDIPRIWRGAVSMLK
ncbi:radical SAM protein, partial [Candidatus Parcubacteria bacterium]